MDGEDPSMSLFEGMILFPSSEVEPRPPSPSPSAASTLSQPLDEDLFSDLTLQIHPESIVQTEEQQAPSPTMTSAPARQLLHRKKKRAVRIGYARDAALVDDFPVDPLPRPVSHPSPPSIPYPIEYEISHEKQRTEVIDEDPGKAITDNVPSKIENSPSLPLEDSTPAETSETEKAPVDIAQSEKTDPVDSFQEKFRSIKAHISRKLGSVRERADSVATKRKEIAAMRRKVTEEMNYALTKHKKLVQELDEACEAEDFERAELISQSLTAVEGDKDRLGLARKDADLEYERVDSEMQEVLELHIVAEEEGVALLEQFAKDAADHENFIRESAKQESSKETESWEASMELLEIRKLEIDIEYHLILALNCGLQSSIDHLVEDEKREKDALMKKGVILAEELADLLELVKSKEAEISRNNAKIRNVDERISSVAFEFNVMQSMVEDKLNKVQAVQDSVMSERETLIAKKMEIDEWISESERRQAEVLKISDISSKEAKSSKDLVALRRSLASACLKSRQDRVRLAKMEETIIADIQTLKQQITDARISLQELSAQRASSQQEMAMCKQQIGFIDKRGPELEAEKKAAAAARNFKEAGRVAAEAKALSAEKEELLIRQQKASGNLEKLEDEIRATTEKIQDSEGLILLKEKESAFASHRRLRLVSALARAERSAALEIGDTEEAAALLEEAESADSKAKELEDCYHLQPDDETSTARPIVSLALITNLAGSNFADIPDAGCLDPSST